MVRMFAWSVVRTDAIQTPNCIVSRLSSTRQTGMSWMFEIAKINHDGQYNYVSIFQDRMSEAIIQPVFPVAMQNLSPTFEMLHVHRHYVHSPVIILILLALYWLSLV